MCTFYFTQTELLNICHRTYFQLLPHIGFNRHIMTQWRTLPFSFYGIGLPDLGCEQTIDQLNFLLKHYGTPTPLGALMSSSFEQLILEIGIGRDFLNHSFRLYGCLATPCWFTRLWEGLEMHGAKVVFQTDADTPLQRVNDEFLIRRFAAVGYSGRSLQRLNKVRLLLRIYSLASIVMAGGHLISEFPASGSSEPSVSSSNFHPWPKEQPSLSDRRLWQ